MQRREATAENIPNDYVIQPSVATKKEGLRWVVNQMGGTVMQPRWG